MSSAQKKHGRHEGLITHKELKKSINTVQLWGLAVGLVIVGEYFGWSYGWGSAGPLGFLVAWAIVSVIYGCFVFSYIELSSSIPHAGGSFAYVRYAFGPVLGYVSGLSTLLTFLFAAPAVSLAIGSYLHLQFPSVSALHLAAIAYLIFAGVNMLGANLSVTFELIITFLAIFELLVFVGVVSPSFSWANFAHDGWAGHNHFSWGSLSGILASVPFAIWFYLGIEGTAMAAEETKDPKKSHSHCVWIWDANAHRIGFSRDVVCRWRG